MYAIVEIAGKQYKVRENDILFVSYLDAEIDEDVTFDRVLLFAQDETILVGTPVIEDAQVVSKVLDHVKADKVIVFKKIRRKRYKVKRGHRQQYTQIQVTALTTNGEEAVDVIEETDAEALSSQ